MPCTEAECLMLVYAAMLWQKCEVCVSLEPQMRGLWSVECELLCSAASDML